MPQVTQERMWAPSPTYQIVQMHVRVMPPCLYSVELVRGVMSKVVACATVNWWPPPMEHAYTKIMMGIICIDTLVELVIARLIIMDTTTSNTIKTSGGHYNTRTLEHPLVIVI